MPDTRWCCRSNASEFNEGIDHPCLPGQVLPGVCPAFRVHVSWEDWLEDNLLWPALIQCALLVLASILLRPQYNRLMIRSRAFRKFCKRYIGTYDSRELADTRLMLMICFSQVATSLLFTVVWLISVYQRASSPELRSAFFVGSLLDILNWMVHRLQGSFLPASFFEANALIDAVTIVPALRHFTKPSCDCDMSWLSFHYLRTFFLLYNYTQIKATGQLDNANVLVQMLTSALLEAYCLVWVMAGSVFTLEVLGDPPFMQDSFVYTKGGDSISFLQMVYWIVISISTVGYGDFAPRTLISRLITCVFVAVGVAYIFRLQFKIQQAWIRNREGSATYRKWHKDDKHAVVLLCLHGNASPLTFSSIVGGLLAEILHSGHQKWPNIIFVSPRPWSSEDNGGMTFSDFLRDRGFGRHLRKHVWYIVGNLSDRKVLQRAGVGSSSMTFLIPESNTSTPDADDELNIFTTLMIRDYFPQTQVRLMLLRPRSKELALQAGIELSRCFSLRELKAHILAQNLRCRGFLPMVTGMLKSVDAHEEELAVRRAVHAATGYRTSSTSRATRQRSGSSWNVGRTSLSSASSDKEDQPEAAKWMSHYVQGLKRSLHGFELSEGFAGWSFGQIVSHVFKDTGALVIAIFEEGRVRVCPQDSRALAVNTICFVLADSPDVLKPVRRADKDADHWVHRLLRMRQVHSRRTMAEGTHYAAAQLLSSELQKTFVDRTGQDHELHDGEERLECDDSPSFETQGKMMDEVAEAQEARMSSRTSEVMNFHRRLSSKKRMSSKRLSWKKEVDDGDMLQRVRELRARLKPNQELVVLIVCHGEVWQQVRTFVSALRARYIPLDRSIVIVAPTAMPQDLLDEFDGVLAIKGSCTRMQELFQAGVLDASCVAVMTGEADDQKAVVYKDSKVALCAQIIECWAGVSPKEIFTMYELQDGNSLMHFPKLIPKQAVCLEELVGKRSILEEKDDSEDEEQELDDEATRLGDRITISASSMSVQAQAAEGSVAGDTNVLFHPRFAAGQIFSHEIWGAMMGKMYYMPAILEIMEALTMPQQRGQDAFPYQIRVPSAYVGDYFSRLVTALATNTVQWSEDDDDELLHEDSQSVQGLLERQISSNSFRPRRQSAPLGLSHMKSDFETRKKVQDTPVLALALYRERAAVSEGAQEALGKLAKGTGGFNYVMLAPRPETKLEESDWILVYGGRSFGRRMNAMGFLRGSEKAKGSSGQTSANQSRSHSGAATPVEASEDKDADADLIEKSIKV
eukprot:TRINITY_DN23688_c0_g1_i1.p1 TRINITY_DN23688_c0_g1~~TRINITY_DN23688_c0_g1_i1.p1  ORF type:complete len:1281 (-),score=241.44 TRINITY_DN23688_c0_g1_i1:26-3793(-)